MSDWLVPPIKPIKLNDLEDLFEKTYAKMLWEMVLNGEVCLQMDDKLCV